MGCLNFKKIVLGLFFVLIYGCNNHPYQKETHVFEEYLLGNFEHKIPFERHFYFIVPKASCIGCRKKVYKMSSRISKMKNSTLLMSGRALQEDLMLEKTKGLRHMEIDSLDKISKIDLGIFNTMLVVTEKEKIQSIHEIKARTDIPGLMKKYYSKEL